ncbi:MAG: PepSY-like domain-containing protein [Chitinophagaceae bacterium]|nr:PepSY-like domain-containing protein [Chitinophagaceae bacterium]
MKKIFLAVLVICTGLVYTANAQVRKIPAEVTNAFSEKYADAKNVEWKDKLSAFAATFELNGDKLEARFNKKGEWQGTEKELSIDDLPAAVKDGFSKSKYTDWETKAVYEVELPDDKKEYKIHVAKSSVQKKILLFDAEGKLLKDNLTL